MRSISDAARKMLVSPLRLNAFFVSLHKISKIGSVFHVWESSAIAIFSECDRIAKNRLLCAFCVFSEIFHEEAGPICGYLPS